MPITRTGTRGSARSPKEHPNLPYWRKGAAAAQKIGLPARYLCPLCLTGYTEDEARGPDILTREHVPPRKLGGKRMVLTCKKCNSAGGSDVDHHAITEEQARRFVTGGDYGRMPIRMSFADLDVIAELRKQRDINLISVLGQCNQSENIERFAEAAKTWGDGTIFQVSFRKNYIQRRSEISWLRSAYLLAFSWLGYRYVCRDVLDAVRTQIRESAEQHIDLFCAYNRLADNYHIIAVQEPSWLRGIAISAHNRIVLLPLYDDDYDFYERLGCAEREGLRIRGRSFSWPEKAMYHLDDMESAELRAFSSLWTHWDPAG